MDSTYVPMDNTPSSTVPSADDPLVGKPLGPYLIRKLLGTGGMARVYVAYQPSMQREVAIKVIPKEQTQNDATFLTRFEREVQVITQLQHVYILPVIDFGSDQGYVYLVMRLVDQSLDAYLRQNGPLPLIEVSRILSQIARALDYTHAHKVIHRDLKPANILLDNQHNCLLADFGIAYLTSQSQRLTATDTVIGTVSYMSPEQLSGKPLTPASDTYALGIMMYEMLAGILPYRGSTAAEIIGQHLSADPVSLHSWRPDLPGGCEAVMLTSIAKDPVRRYQTARALSEAFDVAIRRSEDYVPLQPKPLLVMVPESQIPTAVDTPNLARSHTPAVSNKGVSANTSVQVPVSLPAKSAKTFVKHVPQMWGYLLLALLVVVVSIGVAIVILYREPSPQEAQKDNDSGLAALSNRNYDVAIREFQAAIQADPSYAAAYFDLGVAYEENNDLANARQAYESALHYDDTLLPARYRLGELLLDTKDPKDALTAFQMLDLGVQMLNQGQNSLDVTTHNTLAFELYTARAHAYLAQNRLTLAEDDLKQAAAITQDGLDLSPLYYYRALLYTQEAKPDLAQQCWYDLLSNYDENNARERVWADEARKAVGQQ